MAADSLVGGVTLPGGGQLVLSPGSTELLNSIFSDTIGGTFQSATVPGGVVLSGAGQFGESQSLLAPTAPTIAFSGDVASGTLTVNLTLPPGAGVVLQGLDDKTPAEAATYVNSILDQYLTGTDEGTQTYVTALKDVVKQMTEGLTDAGAKVSVRVVAFSGGVPSSPTSEDSGPASRALASNEVLLDVTTAGNATSKELLAIVMGTVGSGKTLVLKGAEGAVLIGDGTVRFDGLTPVRLSGDAASQNITGGSGRDTIIGGGGNDTVTGGTGSDVFGFNKLTGNLTITDFQVGIDHLGFGIAGVTSASGLASQFTGLTQMSNGVKLSFGNEASITLIGVTAEQLTLDMLQYTL